MGGVMEGRGGDEWMDGWRYGWVHKRQKTEYSKRQSVDACTQVFFQIQKESEYSGMDMPLCKIVCTVFVF